MYENSTFEVKAKRGSKGIWRVSLDLESLTLASVDGDESFQISKADAEEQIEIRETGITKPWIIIRTPKKKTFKLKRAQVASLREWMGPPTIRGLKVTLRRTFRGCLPIGIFIVITSLPISADPEGGYEAEPFDAVSAFIGISLITFAVLARFWPSRNLFLLDGVWFSVAALYIVLDIFQSGGFYRIIIVVFLVLWAKAGFSKYKYFESMII